jgi:hypothetical protein
MDLEAIWGWERLYRAFTVPARLAEGQLMADPGRPARRDLELMIRSSQTYPTQYQTLSGNLPTGLRTLTLMAPIIRSLAET